jgi:hypothetical protein
LPGPTVCGRYPTNASDFTGSALKSFACASIHVATFGHLLEYDVSQPGDVKDKGEQKVDPGTRVDIKVRLSMNVSSIPITMNWIGAW